MKTFKQKLLTLVIALAFAIPVFCAGQTDSVLIRSENGFAADTSRNDTITVYTCPMHPEIQSDKPGNCPKCGMKLVKKTSSVNVKHDGQQKMDMMEDDSTMCWMMDNRMMGKSHMSGMMHDKKKMPMQDGMMMCPMHGNMKKGEMKKGKNKHH